ncbi:Sjogren's syndrome/scleroderma autoantigen 1 family protein [Haloplanus halophilus]|uniref:Sjogren's syndrome/scleroderma autoantigen 1 family protein n=1 Tax=Haloplanus halophilus TaxID=2949993 RepID=UPI00203EF6CC|nr:Sjogren's syndrome/scleroderma autoantigen 1 family protein [Haloplanus sp. GDY1]
MSGFDKEAERERLREKYEQDQEKRAATQRMSELLLQGATMTNDHCDSCGDPIFRYDGREFCPTCQAADDASGETAAAEGEDASGEREAVEADAVEADAPESASDPEAATGAEPATDDAADDGRPSPPAVDSRERSLTAPADRGTESTDAGRGRDAAPTDRRARGSEDGDDSLADARASLSRTLLKFSRAAEEADDPRRAEELLAAAREAAETLSALDDCRI